jgi:hypothetical protein
MISLLPLSTSSVATHQAEWRPSPRQALASSQDWCQGPSGGGLAADGALAATQQRRSEVSTETWSST